MLRPDTTRQIRLGAPAASGAFPEGFRWGVATASYQLEGAADADGRGESIWDRFSRDATNIRDGKPGDTATDHYHRWREDIGLLKELGVNTYRFSIAWPRIQPTGSGTVNQAGLDFYSELVDGLLEAGITPWLTLHHWDLPQAIQDHGGWTSRDTVGRFVEYTDVVFGALHDRVGHWTTLNEPWVMALIGYQSGMLAPGVKGDTQGALQTAHHLLMAHGDAVASMRTTDPTAQLGITFSVQPAYSASDSEADIAAAMKVDLEANRMFIEPVLLGRYPEDYRPTLGRRADLSFIQDGDEARMAQPLDFIGLNYYHGNVVGEAEPGSGGVAAVDSLDSPTAYIVAPEIRIVSRGLPRTAMNWEIDPQGLYDILWEVSRYPGCPPLYVTENGIALTEDGLSPEPIDDPERIDYLRNHIGVVRQAIEDGLDVRGYYVWTFIDCYEWSDGYTRKFGLYHLDEETFERSPKSSARWFADVTRANAV